MKLNRFVSAVLSAALMAGLCACHMDDPLVSDPFARVTARPSHTPAVSEPTPENSGSPEPTPSPGAQYDSNHRLDAAIPELIDGLELPVVGSTGYTSVELPLYRSIPGISADPAPSPTQSQPSHSEPPTESDPPAETGSPTSPPAETGEPAPEPPTQAPEDPEPSAEPVTMAASVFAAAPFSMTAPTSAPKPARMSSSDANVVAVLKPGEAFLILEENGNWWRVSRGDETGWIEHRYCMINLPDVIPSIIYYDPNSVSSIFVSCGKNIPGVTGQVFYNSLVYNTRLGRQEFVMPILYAAARHICAAQHRALAEGNCLMIYETFRPYETQIAVANAMTQMARVDPEVKAGISTPPWSIDWFIATGVANHQQGYALDVSMVKVYETGINYVGSYPYLRATNFEEYAMPTAMHELSMAAASTISPSSSQLSETMNEPAIALRGHFTASGLSPLASEWWHFNDFDAMRIASSNPSDGKYYITECLSRQPEWAI